MQRLGISENVRNYVRDSYLTGPATVLNPDYRCIDCAVGSSKYGVSQKAIEAHARHSVDADSDYPELFYENLLKPTILKRYGLGLEFKDRLFLGHGSFNLAERLIHKLLEPGVMHGIGPQFNEIPSEFIAAGGRYRPIPLQGPHFHFPMEELEARMRRDGVVVYIDNPNNPLGRNLGIDQVRHIVDIAETLNIIVMIDEAYGDFVDDSQSAINLVGEFGNLAVLRSFSKGLGLAAARVGYMFLSQELAGVYRQLDVPFEPTLMSAEMARATLDDSSFLERVRTTARTSKRRLVQSLESVGITVLPTHSTTSILTVHSTDIVKKFASVGVSVEPGSAFRLTHANWDDSYCRVRLPKESDVDELEARIKTLTGDTYAHQR